MGMGGQRPKECAAQQGHQTSTLHPWRAPPSHPSSSQLNHKQLCKHTTFSHTGS